MAFIKRHKRAVLIILACCVLLCAGALYFMKTSRSSFAVGIRQTMGDYLNQTGFPHRPDLKKGLTVTSETVDVDGSAGTMPDPIGDHDVKVIYSTPDGQEFCDYATGFSVLLPADLKADISLSPNYISFEDTGVKIVVSKEWSVGGDDVSGYIGQFFYRFLLDDAYRAQNGIELLENTKTDGVERRTVRLNDYTGTYDTYTYLDFMTNSRFFFHVLLKYSSGDQSAPGMIQRFIDSFKYFKPEGTPVYATDYRPVIPDSWTAETRALYDKIASSDKMMWGIYTKDVTGSGIGQKIPEIEDKLGYQFKIILTYTGLDSGFPTDFMNRCSSEGRVVELTLQATESNNQNLYGPSPWLALYKTGDDARIRAFARAAKAFGKPFLFRLNNEMNSDWVSYGGVTNLLDPDIYAANWRTIYNIFQEEGVNNAIWIFNPNDRDAPPNAWNCQAAYYPGNGYAQIFGVTGYNNGTYYQSTWGESWREFSEIYDKIEADSSRLFGTYPWMITEFASSSVGGDKVKWIENMFDSLPKYPNIKAAVWFSYADYDVNDNVTPARPYWLDETDATLDAFKRGLEKTGELPTASG